MTVTDRSHVPPPPSTKGEWDEDSWDDAELLPIHDAEPANRRSTWLRRILFVAVVLVLGAILVGGAVGLWLVRQVNPPGEPGDPITFTVTESDDLESITTRLKAQRIITDARVFRWYVERKGGLAVAPGFYSLRPRDDLGEIVSSLRVPPAQTYTRVTFPEGFTVRQMARRLGQTVTRLSESAFEAAATDGSVVSKVPTVPPGQTSLEGLLFPDTYQVAGNETEPQVVQRLASLMERVVRQEQVEAKGFALGRSSYEILVIASMIEREAKFQDDRDKISRVIHNRLALGMPLQIDATLFYGQDPDTPFDQLRAADTPYNTYLHTGLPPTPIANPGRASIRAAVNPAPNPLQNDPICDVIPAGSPCQYLYYVLADAEGHHAFAATVEQHDANVAASRAAGLLG
jgi:UPF0755 protein